MDAIDTALVNLSEDELELVHYEQYPIDNVIRTAVRELNKDSSIQKVTELDAVMGHCFADSVLKTLQTTGLKHEQISAIGSHGQTVLHLPDSDHPRTLQIGDPNLIAYKTRITTVSDFRRMDMAAAGQGAPLAPAFHAFKFRDPEKNRVILNIGGIANISILPAETKSPVTGFDTGPGNGLLDDWNRIHNKTVFDNNSEWATSGQANESLLSLLLQDGYFSLMPPKSTGRDYFNVQWLENLLKKNTENLPPEDIQATLLELSVQSIADAINTYAVKTDEVLVCGGGIHNERLLEKLRQKLESITIASTTIEGIDPDAVEAITFAWLASCRVNQHPPNLYRITGANENTLLGGIYESVRS